MAAHEVDQADSSEGDPGSGQSCSDPVMPSRLGSGGAWSVLADVPGPSLPLRGGAGGPGGVTFGSGWRKSNCSAVRVAISAKDTERQGRRECRRLTYTPSSRISIVMATPSRSVNRRRPKTRRGLVMALPCVCGSRLQLRQEFFSAPSQKTLGIEASMPPLQNRTVF